MGVDSRPHLRQRPCVLSPRAPLGAFCTYVVPGPLLSVDVSGELGNSVCGLLPLHPVPGK